MRIALSIGALHVKHLFRDAFALSAQEEHVTCPHPNTIRGSRVKHTVQWRLGSHFTDPKRSLRAVNILSERAINSEFRFLRFVRCVSNVIARCFIATTNSSYVLFSSIFTKWAVGSQTSDRLTSDRRKIHESWMTSFWRSTRTWRQMTKGVPKFLTPLDQTCSDSHPMKREAPRHEQIAPHGRIRLAPPPATILGKSPIKLSETPPNPISVLREMPSWRGASRALGPWPRCLSAPHTSDCDNW